MLSNIKKEISNLFKDNPYVIVLDINSNNKLLLIYDYTMIDSTRLQRDIIPLLDNKDYEKIIINLKEIQKNELSENIFSGSIVIYDYKSKTYNSLNLNNIPSRSVEESSIDITISGPKDALIESLDKNIALIQKRIKSSKLIIKNYTIGSLTKTKVALLYIDELINEKVIDSLNERLTNTDLESLTNIGQLEGILANKKSLVPLLTYTARCDFIAESMLSHKVAILVDGIPLALIAPSTFHFFLIYHESLSENYFVIIFDRILFLFSFLIAIGLSPFVLAVINYYPELLPTELIYTAINSRKGISLSFTTETILAELLFQMFRIAGTRLPKGLDSSILVVGSFLIGNAIIDAGIISQEALYIAASSVIASYVISNNSSFNTSINIFRWFLILSTILFGFVGMNIGILIILIYLVSKESIYTPYLYPIAPFNFKDLKKELIPITLLNKKKEKNYEKDKNSISN